MIDPEPEKPRRRVRYRGKNPRRFHEKYKEHQPGRYPEQVARVMARGQTPAGTHRPIMVREILDVLSPRPGDVAVDCTLGYGGHAQELLAAVQPGGRLLGIDADPIELTKTEARLRTLGFPPDAVIVRRMNYAGVARFLADVAPDGADVLLADLGLSSMQIDDPSRGFTFKVDGPLDMRMDPTRGRTASDLLSTLDETGLARILAENSDEPDALELASAILARSRAHADHLDPITRRGRASDRCAAVPTLRPLGRRRGATRLPGPANRCQRRIGVAHCAPPQPPILPQAGRPSRHPLVPFGRGPPGEIGLQGRSARRHLYLDRNGSHPRQLRGEARQPTFFGGQAAIRGPSFLILGARS